METIYKMSIILITQHDENIYNITKSQGAFKSKAPPYKSKFRDRTIKTHKHLKRCVKLHATMGLPEEQPPDPTNYLKKHTGVPSYTLCKPPKEAKPCEQLPHRDKVPTLSELAKIEEKSRPRKNFVVQNIKTMSKMKAKDPEPKTVVDKNGTTKPLKAGLEPVYIKLPKFGKTPNYLVRFIQIKEKEYQMKKDATGVQQPLCRYITRDEREKLLNGLKQNWEELQKQYQVLPILTDTIPKKIRKSKMEADLKQLEKDIVLVERHPYIYVYDDNNETQ